jgi:hypothetical protein
MAVPIGAIISAAATVGSQGVNAMATGKLNRKTRQYNEHMYQWQRDNALSDMQMQNEYNSPAAQMQRFKAAGLNPHLIYGQQNESATVRSSSAPSWSPEAPKFNLQDAVSNYQNYQKQDVQTDNIKALTEVAKQQAALHAAEILKVSADTKRTGVGTAQDELNLQHAKDNYTTSLDAAKADLHLKEASIDKTKADTQFTLDSNERAKIMNSYNVKEAISKLLTMQLERQNIGVDMTKKKQEISNLMQSSEMNELDLQLKRLGIQPHDPAYMRVVETLSVKINQSIGKGWDYIRSHIKDWLSNINMYSK